MELMMVERTESPVKAGYKQTELGVIPEDWNNATFGEVLTGFSSGMTPYRGNPEFYKGNIKWITSGELKYNIITDTKEKITPDAVIKTNLKLLPKGTFLMAITGLEAAGTRGSCGITGVEATTNQSCMALFPTNRLITEYLYHFYVRYGNELAFKYCQGTKQQSYTGRIAKLLPINLPPTLIEQQAIAKALRDVDALINNLGKLITKKKAIKQGAMQQLLKSPKQGGKRLPGFEGEWEEKRIGDVCQIFGRIGFRGYTVEDIVEEGKGAVTISPSNIIGSRTDFKKATYISWFKYEESPEIKIYNNDILLVKTGSTVGKTALVIGLNQKATINPQIVVLKKTTCDNRLLGYLMGSKIVQDQIVTCVVGGAIPTLSQKQILNFKITLPPTLAEQEAIATILSDMDTEIENLEKKKAKYQSIKQGMMQELLTGKTRLV